MSEWLPVTVPIELETRGRRNIEVEYQPDVRGCPRRGDAMHGRLQRKTTECADTA